LLQAGPSIPRAIQISIPGKQEPVMAHAPRTTVPLMLVLDDEGRWPTVIRELKRIGTGRVMLATPSTRHTIKHYRQRLGAAADQDPLEMGAVPHLGFYSLWADLFTERQAQLQAAGIPEVGLWFAQTIGHGEFATAIGHGLDHLPLQPMMDEKGATEPGTFCPLCDHLRSYLGAALARLARARPSVIMFDDDFRMFCHNKVMVGCYCPLHQADFRRRGIDATMPELARLVTEGPPNPQRTAWWAAQDDSLTALARSLSEAIHAVDPAIRVGVCTARSLWDETDIPALLRTFAGGTRPFVRTTVAPYWISAPWSLGCELEHLRLLHARLAANLPEAEVLCEGDSYPHLTTKCPAQTLHAYLQAVYAGGASQVLTYVQPYGSAPHFESGYTDLLAGNQARYDAIQHLVPAASRDRGLTIPWRGGGIRTRHLLPGDFNPSNPNDPIPHKLCARLGLPVAHGDSQGPVLLAGTQAALANEAELETWAARGLVLDAPAAQELQRRGLACGLESAGAELAPNCECFHDLPLHGRFAGGTIALKSGARRLYHRCAYLSGAEILTTLRSADDRVWGPGVARWTDPVGRRFAILPWDLASGQAFSDPMLMLHHARRYQLHRLLEWVARHPLAATVDAPNAQVMVRQHAGRTVITVLNGSLDPLVPMLRLDPRLGRPDTVSLLGPEGDGIDLIPASWGRDGEALTLALPCTLACLGFCAVAIPAPRA
jgi:hypothetical protein